MVTGTTTIIYTNILIKFIVYIPIYIEYWSRNIREIETSLQKKIKCEGTYTYRKDKGHSSWNDYGFYWYRGPGLFSKSGIYMKQTLGHDAIYSVSYNHESWVPKGAFYPLHKGRAEYTNLLITKDFGPKSE
jgi:hypothetical protein